MKIILVLLFSVVFKLTLCVDAYSQCEEDQIICWSKNRKLLWSDFKKVKVNDKESFDALTYSYIHVIPLSKSEKPDYKVFAKFDRIKSWVNDNRSKELLDHEQLHFDISELYTRKIRKGIDSLHLFGVSDKKKYIKLINELMSKCNKTNDFYDQETYHGSYDEMQKIWELRISEELLNYDKYKF